MASTKVQMRIATTQEDDSLPLKNGLTSNGERINRKINGLAKFQTNGLVHVSTRALNLHSIYPLSSCPVYHIKFHVTIHFTISV